MYDGIPMIYNSENKTGIVYDERYLNHKTGNHPESPERLAAIYEYLKDKEIFKKLKKIKPYPSPVKVVEYIHNINYIKSVKHLSEMGGGMLDMDTVLSRETYDIALLAVGGVLAAIDAVMDRVVKNAFCLIRPPGHHALPDRGMGFCIFNNIAIGARYLQKEYNIERVAIIDWDVHHGNGTQDAFYRDPSVFYFSLHQFPHYPGTGDIKEDGLNEGKGYTMNAPLRPGAEFATYKEILENHFLPAIVKFSADFILISSGFDAHRDDPLSSVNLQTEDYHHITKLVVSCAEETCKGRIVSVLEGGYNLNALRLSVCEHLRGLME